MKIEFDSFEDLKNFLDDLGFELQKKSANAVRCKRYRDGKKNVEPCQDMSCDTKEEREEKEEVLPFSPSSLSSSPLEPPNNNPITPISPLPEEREEREEKQKRGELESFGEFVRLSRKEYDRLVNDFGQDETDRMISGMNSYIGESPGRIRKYKSRNHNLTLRNWHRMDEGRKKPQEPKVKTTADYIAELDWEGLSNE